MALDRLHLRRLRKNEPRKASAAARRHFRRAGYNWSFGQIRALRSKMWIVGGRRPSKRLREFLRELQRLERQEAWRETMT